MPVSRNISVSTSTSSAFLSSRAERFTATRSGTMPRPCHSCICVHTERSSSAVALMFIDLDRFKFINDTLGHDHGDQLLRATAARIKSAVRAQDTVARLGGDEFTVILEGISRPEDAAPVAEKVLAQMNMPFKLGQNEVLVTSSIGIAIYPANARDVEELIRAADNAMYRVKDRGRNGFQFFTVAMNVNVTGRGSMAVSLRHALARNEFEVNYQPQVDLR